VVWVHGNVEKAEPLNTFPQTSIFFFEISSFKNHTEKGGELVFDLKKVNIDRFWKLFLKKFDITFKIKGDL